MSLHFSKLPQDVRNVELLQLLRANPRMNILKLARLVGMSTPAVPERVLGLEDAGVIRGCRLDLDPAALGYSVCA